jgi:hypothetical protein
MAQFRWGSQPEKSAMTARAKPAPEAKATSTAPAVPHRRSHELGQVPRDPQNQASPVMSAKDAAYRAAEAILQAALARGIRVGTDGDDLVMLVPVRVPGETRRQFESLFAEFRVEIIAAIQADAARRGASS